MRKRGDPKDFPLVPVILFAGSIVLAWAAVQAWLLHVPMYGLFTAVGALIGCILSYFLFNWLKRKRSEAQK